MSADPKDHCPPLALLYSTWPDPASAQSAATTLLEEKLIACANILAPMTSVYEWRGRVECETEIPALFKTSRATASKARDRLMALHPYEEPAIIGLATDAEASSAPFARWVKAQTPETAGKP